MYVTKTPSQLDAEIAEILRARKWQRDGLDRYETWWLGDEESPIAQVHPNWGITRAAGQGKPDDWTVVVGDKRVRAATAAEGKKKALELLRSS
jgi:hypothetical protein